MKKVVLVTFFITLIGVSIGKKHRECYHTKPEPMCDRVEYYNSCKFNQALRKNQNLKEDYAKSCLNKNRSNEVLNKNPIFGSASKQIYH